MNLDQLIARGAIIQPAMVKKTVTWKHREDGELNEDTFDIHVKKDVSAADFQFIFSGQSDDEYALMPRRVHRLVTLGENGEEKIPYPAAASMRLSLLIALCTAINEVEEESELLHGAASENAGEEKN